MANLSPFETFGYYEFDDPFESVADFAAYIMHPDNTSQVYVDLGAHIRINLQRRISLWPVDLLNEVLKLPEASALLASHSSCMDEFNRAAVMLSSVVNYLRDQSSDEEAAS